MTDPQITACDPIEPGATWLCAVTSASDPSAGSDLLPAAPAAVPDVLVSLPIFPIAGWAAAGAAVGVIAVLGAREAWSRYAAWRYVKRGVITEVTPTGEAEWRWAVSVPSIDGLYTQAARIHEVPAAVVDAAKTLGVYVNPKDVRIRVVTPEPTTTPPNPPPFTVPDGMGGFRPYNPDPDAFPPLPDGARYWHDVRADRERMDAEGVREVDAERADSEPIAADDLWDEDEYAAYAATLEPVNLDEPSAAKGDRFVLLTDDERHMLNTDPLTYAVFRAAESVSATRRHGVRPAYSVGVAAIRVYLSALNREDLDVIIVDPTTGVPLNPQPNGDDLTHRLVNVDVMMRDTTTAARRAHIAHINRDLDELNPAAANLDDRNADTEGGAR